MVTTRHPCAKALVTAQIALDLFENKENTRSVLLHSSTTGISYGHMFDAVIGPIGAFERTLLTPDSPFDKYVRGEGKISPAAVRGMKKVNDIGCTACHSGPLFTNNTFQKFDYGTDPGRKSITGKNEDDHIFRVQSWRNIAMTAPYFHNGSVQTLDEAVRIMAKVQLDTDLSDADVADIVVFLKTLTGVPPRVEFPVLPRPAGKTLNWSD